jgi:hypothetical protein
MSTSTHVPNVPQIADDSADPGLREVIERAKVTKSPPPAWYRTMGQNPEVAKAFAGLTRSRNSRASRLRRSSVASSAHGRLLRWPRPSPRRKREAAPCRTGSTPTRRLAPPCTMRARLRSTTGETKRSTRSSRNSTASRKLSSYRRSSASPQAATAWPRAGASKRTAKCPRSPRAQCPSTAVRVRRRQAILRAQGSSGAWSFVRTLQGCYPAFARCCVGSISRA